MTPTETQILKEITELKASLLTQQEGANQKIYILLFGVVGTLIGAIVTTLLTLWKDKILFKQNLKKEETIAKRVRTIEKE